MNVRSTRKEKIDYEIKNFLQTDKCIVLLSSYNLANSQTHDSIIKLALTHSVYGQWIMSMLSYHQDTTFRNYSLQPMMFWCEFLLNPHSFLLLSYLFSIYYKDTTSLPCTICSVSCIGLRVGTRSCMRPSFFLSPLALIYYGAT